MNDQQREQLQTAQAQVSAGHYADATPTLLRLYDESDDEAVLAPLAHSFLGQHQITEANRLVDEHFAFFVTQQLGLLTEVLLADRRFVELHILLAQLPAVQTEAERTELQATETTGTNLDEAGERQFKHLGAFTPQEQQAIIAQAEHLPLANYVAAAVTNLRDPDVYPIWRLQLLNNLMRLRIKTPVSFIWIDQQTYTVQPDQLVEVTETTAYEQLQRLVTTKYGQVDPIKQTQLMSLMQVELQNLYPFIDRIITDPKQWLEQLERQSQGEPLESATSSVTKWLTLIEKLMAGLISEKEA
ncbi:hypothetical protein M3M35_02135 [Fructilactobacillus myrtifloralis]|uniref:BS_ysoA related protein with TPR repeats n=1 Tax=Fructilactobacillus myrtifloralis TaxID=2940301 RepID=A0ABY5BP60_9LACO|nr:hypothetical protein [Fructilactobacillus myrtifloralis]USS85485.1 hypothetical protein M3M35_02135 [Fructilactobacillus myrtifloralis]